MICFDLRDNDRRNSFVKKLKENGVLCNPTRENTVRFRPHLLTETEDFEMLVNKIIKSIKN